VNGHLFSGSRPLFSKIARSYLIHIGNLSWTEINPDIFGSMIQAVADDEERGALGMHYTIVPNMLKVLSPLFLDRFVTMAKLAIGFSSPSPLSMRVSNVPVITRSPTIDMTRSKRGSFPPPKTVPQSLLGGELLACAADPPVGATSFDDPGALAKEGAAHFETLEATLCAPSNFQLHEAASHFRKGKANCEPPLIRAQIRVSSCNIHNKTKSCGFVGVLFYFSNFFNLGRCCYLTKANMRSIISVTFF
jgi:hypothetical protein